MNNPRLFSFSILLNNQKQIHLCLWRSVQGERKGGKEGRREEVVPPDTWTLMNYRQRSQGVGSSRSRFDGGIELLTSLGIMVFHLLSM